MASLPSISSFAPLRSASMVRVKGRVMRKPPLTMLLSGPTIRLRMTSPLRRSTVCSPPVNAACPSSLAVEK